MSGLDTLDHINDEYKINTNNQNIKYKNIIGLYNLTQKDKFAETADIGIVYINKTEYYSITQWKVSLTKCICNPSGKIYNICKTDSINDMVKNYYNKALKYREDNYGNTPNKKWKRLKDCKCSIDCMSEIAKLASIEWNKFSNDDKIKKLHKILDLDYMLETNCTGIIYFNDKTNCIESIYNWKLNIDLNNYLNSINDGIWVYHFGDNYKNDFIIRTQVKFNDGIIQGLNDKNKWKITVGSPVGSWNCVAEIQKIFNLTHIYVLQ
jgi:hypothetical protein